jgi:hypothetical protein
MVGDTTADTGMATNAGVGLMVGVLTGAGTREQLMATGAHMTLPSVGGIPDLLQALNLLQKQEQSQNGVFQQSIPLLMKTSTPLA